MITLTVGHIWVPRSHTIAPREIRVLFRDVTGAEYVRWCFPWFPETGEAVLCRTFKMWIRRTGAQPE